MPPIDANFRIIKKSPVKRPVGHLEINRAYPWKIDKLVFQRIVRDISCEINPELRYQTTAVEFLQDATEKFMMEWMDERGKEQAYEDWHKEQYGSDSENDA